MPIWLHFRPCLVKLAHMQPQSKNAQKSQPSLSPPSPLALPLPLPPLPGKAVTPIAFVQAIVLAFEKYGVDAAPALARAQIPPKLLTQPSARVTAAQFEIFSFAAMQALDDEALGWFSRKLPWGAYGMLCRASLTSSTLELALKRWCRHHRILVADISLELKILGATATLTIREQCDLGPFREFCLVTSLRYVLGYACWAIDEKIALLRADFPFAEPAHSAVYPALFSRHLRFEAPIASVRFDARYLALPIKRDEKELNLMLDRALLLTVLPYRRDRLFVSRVRQILRKPHSNFPTADAVAESLAISTRTLHRQLQREGASLRKIKEAARMEQAMEALTRSKRPIKQVALAIGFLNEKSFSRAFKNWTGEAPGVFRARHKTA